MKSAKKCRLYIVKGNINGKIVNTSIRALSLESLRHGFIMEHSLKDLVETRLDNECSLVVRLQGSNKLHKFKVVV